MVRNSHILYTLLALLLILFPGCDSEKTKIRRVLEDFEKTQIVIPEDMMMIQDGEVRPYHVPDSLPIFIVYAAPKECSACKVAHLGDYEELFELGREFPNFHVMVILSPSADKVDEVRDRLSEVQFRHSVYLDCYSDFASGNAIPDDPRFHCFLLDRERFPVFVGNPIAGKDLRNLFEKYLFSN